nr:MAG TPA: hypothetical protein [Inoviridae sp.]
MCLTHVLSFKHHLYSFINVPCWEFTSTSRSDIRSRLATATGLLNSHRQTNRLSIAV